MFVALGLAEATILPFFAIFLDEKGFNAAEIGLVLALASLASFIAGPIWGYAADHWLGAERALALSATGAAGCSLLFFLPGGRLLSTAVAVAIWVMRSPLASLIDAIALAWLGPARRSGYGGIRLWMSAGWAAAVIVWGALLELQSLDLIPALYAGTILLVAAWARFGLENGRRPTSAGAPRLPVWRRRAPALPPALVGFLVSLFLVNATFFATFQFLALRIKGLGGGAFLIGVAASLQAIGEIPALASTGRLTRLLSHRALYVAGCGVYIVVYAAWAVIDDAVAITAIKLVVGVGFALSYVGTVVIVDDLVPHRLRATGQGVAKAVSFGLAPVLGALGGGLVYDLLGPGSMFVASSALAAGAGAIAWLVVPVAKPQPVEVEAVG